MMRHCKAFWLSVLVAAVSLAAAAQTHGVPASVLSPTANHPFGPASSVTSPGPNGFGDEVVFSPQLASRGATAGRGHRHRIPQREVVPVYVPVVADYEMAPEPDDAALRAREKAQAEAQTTHVVVVDSAVIDAAVEKKLAAALEKLAAEKSLKEKQQSDAGKAERQAPPASAIETPVANKPEELTVTYFVLRDGTRRELHNYAIASGNVYDLADGGMKAIPLESVDLEATRKANQDAGQFFRLP